MKNRRFRPMSRYIWKTVQERATDTMETPSIGLAYQRVSDIQTRRLYVYAAL